MIPTEKIEQLKSISQDNMVEIINDFVPLKKSGNLFVGLSPFSNERTPSFTVNLNKGIFKDFSSGNGGDCLKFLMLVQDWKFLDALRYVAKKYNIELDDKSDINYSYQKRLPVQNLQPDFIHPNTMLGTVGNYDKNNLYKFLCDKFGEHKTNKAFKDYYIGVTGNWTIFWQIDIDTYVRSGKFIKYLPNGRRDKDCKASWEHAKTKEYKPVYPNFNLVQCFFGEHLIGKKPIAIVESEKTALVASILLNRYTWIACGSKNGLNDVKCGVLANRSVILFPDLGCFKEWSEIAVKKGYSISNLIENKATEDDIRNGLDIADFLMR